KALGEWRNVPHDDGLSPSQMLLGRKQRGILPNVNDLEQKLPTEIKKSSEARQSVKRRKLEKANEKLKELKPLQVGQAVTIQNPTTRRWNEEGIITSVRKQGRSYIIETQNGWTTTRNRKFLKPLPTISQRSTRRTET
ncbi:Hypothetical predicted protein, partial [Paramuricea clavata]